MKSEMKNAHMFSEFQSTLRNSHVPDGLRPKIRGASLALTFLGLMLFFGSVAHAATFHVTTTIDNNNNANATPGSLRKAIVDANTNPGTDTIDFNIAGAGVHRFSLTAALPVISDPVVMDGYTQPGAVQNSLANSNNAVLLIEITGTNLFNFSVDNGLAITAGSTTIRGLIINGFKGTGIGIGSGIRISSKGQNVIAGNFIGTDFNGTNQIPNGYGIEIVGSDNNVIGGNQPFSRNLISGNTKDGIDIQLDGSYNNLIVGNFIGTNRSGTGALGNGGSGIAIGNTGTASSAGEIGGTFAGAGNVISANLGEGISLWGTTTGVKIEGNLIGTDITGKVGLGNTYNGVELQTTGTGNVIGGLTVTARNIISANGGAITVFEGDSTIILGNYIGTDITGKVGLGNKSGIYIVSSFNTLGGAGATDGNVISANGEYGIYIADSKGNFVNRNLIGIGADGTTALGNNGPGIIVYEGSNNIIGGSVAGSNAIAFNAGPGVRLEKGNNNQITYNSISSNQNLGIDLDLQGVTSNDPGDADTGPNNLQNFPVLTLASHLNNGLTTVDGTLNSAANTQFSINFYANTVADPTGFGEGQVSLGSLNVKTDANGNGNFTGSFAGLSVGQCVSATAMDPTGNTSEFSQCLTITPNAAGSLQFISAAYNVNENAGKATVTLSRSGGNFGTVSVQYATVAGGTTTAGSDYSTVSGTVTWGHGDASDKTFTIPIIDDSAAESNETINLALSNATNGTQPGSPTTAVLTINDNDSQSGNFSFSAASYSVNENEGQATITVTRNAGSNGAVSVQYATTNGSATAGGDYTAGSSTLNWANGDAASKTFTIPIVNDSVDEADETVSLALSNPTGGATLGSPASAVLTIVDDDPAPKVSINDVSQAEGNSGTTNVTFNLTLSSASAQAVKVNYSTGDSTAQAGSDYQAANGIVTFAPGETSKQVTVLVNGDTQVEPDEAFFVNLSNPTNATISKAQGVGTIENDDAGQHGSLAFSAASYTVGENVGQATITVTRTGGSFGQVSAQYATTNGSATGNDYTSANGTLNWADGDSASKTFKLAIVNDSLDEFDETVNVTLSSPAGGATLDSPSSATLTIADDDPAPTISIDDISAPEGSSGTTAFTFTVSLSAASGQTISVDYITADNPAQAGSDYQAANGVVTFAPGETSKQVTVLVNGDTQVEPDEAFMVNLSGATDGTIAKSAGAGTIVNDDSNSTSPTIQFSQATYSVPEDLGAMSVTVTRTGDTSAAASVDYTTVDGSAAQKADFEYAAGIVTFAAGETSKTVTILLNEDALVEGNETFNLTLSNPAGAVLGTQSSTTATIVDDLSEPMLSPVDDAQAFVYTHYHDFLNREPDAAGLAFWTSHITACGTDAKCIDAARVNVSASFFLSIEFQETAYLLYLMQKESYTTMPKYASFMRDLQEVSRGVVVNAPGWQQKLADNQQQFADNWINRPEFKAAYDSLSNDAYVDTLYKNAGIAPPQAAKDKLVTALNGASMNRSAVLLEVAADATFRQQQQNAAFVLMEYFGYLRRDPNASPDTDLSGYNFWLNKLDQFNGNYVDAEMIKAFITSFEYRQRFGQ